MPVSPGTLAWSRPLVALGRAAVLLALVGLPLWNLDMGLVLGGFAGLLHGRPVLLLLAVLAFTPLAAAVRLVEPNRLRITLQGVGVALAAGSAVLATEGSWSNVRMWRVALSDPRVLAVFVAAWALGIGWLAAGLPKQALGSVRGRASWGVVRLGASLLLLAVFGPTFTTALPEPDWRDLRFFTVEVLDAEHVLVRANANESLLQPPSIRGTRIVDVGTWQSTPLPAQVHGLVKAGDRWGRLMHEGDERWLDLAASPGGPAEVQGPAGRTSRPVRLSPGPAPIGLGGSIC